LQIDQRRIARLQGLLSWAVEFVEREVKCLVDSNRDPKTGDCDGANRFAFATQPDCAMIGFQTNERRVRFVLPIPRSERQSHAKFEQRRRAEAIAVCKTAKISGY
jgi:hypothetical protein